jgi:hypothetical protein
VSIKCRYTEQSQLVGGCVRRMYMRVISISIVQIDTNVMQGVDFFLIVLEVSVAFHCWQIQSYLALYCHIISILLVRLYTCTFHVHQPVPAFFFVIRAWSICPGCTAALRLIVQPFFNPPYVLDVPTFAARCLHVHTTREIQAAKGGTCRREY